MKELIAGVDEVGRGCLAGPVIAAAVILNNSINNLNDSKKISKDKREHLSTIIMQNSFFAFGHASHQEIDEINIHNASLLAMKRAILNLNIKPNKVLVDGLYLPDVEYKKEAIVGGDAIISEISAASIIAKVYRDNLMLDFDKKYPIYKFNKHKGYPTKFHKEMLKIHGSCPIHRHSFKGVS
ncbi:ribonuclease HII [Gammaproteobacteria bacterium]|nr:ribonuclease HII [Gammaproteobacteria bacterium]MDA9011190.1 ribonuclease HII [Gammaproteobacteria bacterium]MDA9024546.1 ribonuclease HII [Gammaproteobacteria bacterium]MDA9117365.1 ribonuclease HII [Gammaproteobacteria bacterium]MDA9842317.1 ribonuclease HII [Gammaproteobacteria bacterium]